MRLEEARAAVKHAIAEGAKANSVLKLSAGDAKRLLHYGVYLLNRGALEEAYGAAELLKEILPESFAVCLFVGSVYAKKKLELPALELLKKAQTLNPKHPRAFVSRAE